MNILSRDQQIQVIAALTEGMGIRAITRELSLSRKAVRRASRATSSSSSPTISASI